MDTKRWTLMWAVAIVGWFYTTFVLQSLWNWFVVAALNAPQISYWIMFGLHLMIQVIAQRDDSKDELRWKWVDIVLTRCIPEERREEVAEEIQAEKDQLAAQLGLRVFSIAFGNTFVLGLGWVVHALVV